MTNNLIRRVFEHREGNIDGFSKKYQIKKLIYYEEHSNPEGAILREKQIKKWKRDWKIRLIEEGNPNWNDLYEKII
jgi:putative endonuclease